VKRTLIKTAVILVFMYFVFFVFAEYRNYVSITYHYSRIIVIALMLILGFICGLILNYEVIISNFKNRKKANIVLIVVSIILLVIGCSPYFAYMLVAKFVNNGILMDQLYQFVIGLMAGYCFSSAFSAD